MSKSTCNTCIIARGDCMTVPEGKNSSILNDNWKGPIYLDFSIQMSSKVFAAWCIA